jgi:hypothetical protein
MKSGILFRADPCSEAVVFFLKDREQNISADITVVNPAKPCAKASKAGVH